MRARKVADVESSDMNMIKLACSRERAKLKHDTSYDHLNLAAYVQSALGGTWRVILPPALGVSYSQTFLSLSTLPFLFNFSNRKSSLPPSFPSASATPTLHLTCDLDLKSSNSDASIDLVAEKIGISRAEAADNICGHCETAAVALTGALCVSVTC